MAENPITSASAGQDPSQPAPASEEIALAADNAPQEPSLTTRAATGFVWSAASTLGAKVLMLGQGMVLARLLSKEEFGLVGTALAIAAFPAVLQSGAVSTVLVQRQRRYRNYANPAFWLTTSLAVVAAALISIAAPFAAAWYKHPELMPMLWVAAATTVVSGVGVSALALLQIRLKFKLLAMLQLVNMIVTTGTSIGLALLKLGGLSILIGTLAGATVNTALLWYLARPPVRRSMQQRRWRWLMGDSSRSMGMNLIWTAVGQGDRLAIGAVLNQAAVGVYTFSYQQSLQASTLIQSNLTSVLFPTIARLTHDPQRQVQAYMRAARLLAVVGVPIAMLQAAAAQPGVILLFGPKWIDAIELIQIMSLGMAANVVSGSCTSLLLGQGRFSALLYVAIAWVFAFFSCFALGGFLNGLIGAVTAVSVLQWVFAIVGMWFALRPGGVRVTDICQLYFWPVFASLGGASLGLGAAELVHIPERHAWIGYFAQGAIIAITMGTFYVGLMMVVQGELLKELGALMKGMVQRGRQSRPESGSAATTNGAQA